MGGAVAHMRMCREKHTSTVSWCGVQRDAAPSFGLRLFSCHPALPLIMLCCPGGSNRDQNQSTSVSFSVFFGLLVPKQFAKRRCCFNAHYYCCTGPLKCA